MKCEFVVKLVSYSIGSTDFFVKSSSVSLKVQLKALQTLESVFQCREHSIAFPFINALAPHIVMILNDMCVNKPTSEDQLTVTLEAIKILENLVDLTDNNLSMSFCLVVQITGTF